jgi:hypothetical protein
MCEMEVRQGQRASTIAQAIAHNVGTCKSDCEMYRQLLIGRGDVENLHRVETAQIFLAHAYESLLYAFGTEIAHDVDTGHNPDEHIVGNERAPRTLLGTPEHPCPDCGATGEHSHLPRVRPVDREMVTRAAEIAAAHARRYETR